MVTEKQTVTVDVFGLIKFVKTNIVRNLNEYKANKNTYGYDYNIFQILDYGGHCNYEAYYILKHVLNKLTTISAEIKYNYVVFDDEQIKAEFDNAIKEACLRWTRREQYHGPSKYEYELSDNKLTNNIIWSIGKWILAYSKTLVVK